MFKEAIRDVVEGTDGAIAGILMDFEGIPVESYAKGFTDGKWHKVTIPVSAFVKGPGAKFDLASFWEFRIATWSAAPRHFDIYVDDITAEKQ